MAGLRLACIEETWGKQFCMCIGIREVSIRVLHKEYNDGNNTWILFCSKHTYLVPHAYGVESCKLYQQVGIDLCFVSIEDTML